ncbi:alanine racemase [Austwickia chelonae]|uniref:alanine racemase n=1 Tax=Austwickia chelonae TaxID=100225 RepID=UPI001F077B78|nr:alanine racemase [Austwickia chelonae]
MNAHRGEPGEDIRAAVHTAHATGRVNAPAAVVDLTAFTANAELLRTCAAGRLIRVATKSVRCRPLLERTLALPGFAGLMAFSLAEALWLADSPDSTFHDVLVAYPSTDRTAWARLTSSATAAQRITVMIDDENQLGDTTDTAAPVQICLDVDASLRIGPAHLGARRSPLRTPEQVVALARRVATRPGCQVAGLMFYDAQIAGLPDRSMAVRAVKALSDRELRMRRGEVVAAVAAELERLGVPPLRLVNGGGSGSLRVTGADPCLTEVAAGSGLYAPTAFDGYRGWSPRPALFVVVPVVRRPAPGMVTVFGGGYVASGAAGRSRLPRPVWPTGLRLTAAEGAGEVQTPLRVARGAHIPQVGELVWLRPTKAGEPLERFGQVSLVEGGRWHGMVPTYRGEGRSFG